MNKKNKENGIVTLAEVISSVAEGNPKSTKSETKVIIDDFLNQISICLSKGDSVKIPNFGKFTVKERDEKEGRNPQTGKTITIPKKTIVKFAPFDSLKKKVNHEED